MSVAEGYTRVMFHSTALGWALSSPAVLTTAKVVALLLTFLLQL